MRKWKRRTRAETLVEAQRNEYYEEISARLGILQVILYMGLFAFVVLSFLRNTEMITYRNFYYFFKDLNASAETVDVFESDAVSYPTASEQSFALYRQGLAVAGSESVTVFTATGRQTVSQTIQYRSPIAAGAGRYLLVYEMGGKQFSLYNAYTQMFTGTSDYPIYGAAVSDSGMFALISRSEEYTSVVSLYNSSFRLINRYSKNGYVTDVAISQSGDLIAIPAAKQEGGLWRTQVALHKPYDTADGRGVEIGQSMPLSCDFSEEGVLSLLCTDGIGFVSGGGDQIDYQRFEGRSIVCATVTRHGAAVVLRGAAANDRAELLVFDGKGAQMGAWTPKEAPQALDRAGDTVFCKLQDGVLRINAQSGEQVLATAMTENRTLLAVNESECMLCSPQKANYLRFS